MSAFASDAEAIAWIARWYPVIAAQQVRGAFVHWRAGQRGPEHFTPVRRFAAHLRRQRIRRGKPV